MESHATSKHEHRSGWQWWFYGVAAMAAFAFGAFGLWRYEVEHGVQPDVASIFYHTLQLFILHAPHLDTAVPWQLHVGRLLAAGVFFAISGEALWKAFRQEVLLSPWRGGHVVVCGLGDLGLRLALDAKRRRNFVVAIEKQSSPGTAVAQARASGVLVLEGNAIDPAQLRRARVGRAEFLVAACQDDHTNVAIAALVGQLVQPQKKRVRPLVCRALIRDPKLRALMSDESLFPNTGSSYRVNFSDLGFEDTAARQAFRRYPLDFEPIREKDETVVHLVVIGFGGIGQSLVLHAARIGHFANEVGPHSIRLRITVADKDQTSGWNDFEARYDKLHEVCVAKFAAHVPGESGFFAAMDDYCPSAGSDEALVTYALCLESTDPEADDEANLGLGLELMGRTAKRPAQVLIHQNSRRGFANLFPEKGRGSRLSGRVHAFGMGEEVFAWDVLLHESEDKLARVLHEDYQARRAAEEISDSDNPNWEDLSADFKDSNRQAADHIAAKLRALGYHDEPWTRAKHRIEKFEDEELLLLAKMEHARWSAERWLAGWKRGPARDTKKKISDCLVPWDQLPLDKQKRDREQIAAIPEALSRIGRGIYR